MAKLLATLLPLLLLAAAAHARSLQEVDIILTGCYRGGNNGCISEEYYCKSGRVYKCSKGQACSNAEGCVDKAPPLDPSPPLLGGSRQTVKAVNATKYVPGAKTPFPNISKCPKGFHKNKNDREVVIGCAVIDAYFIQMAQPAMKSKYPDYYCKNGAVFDDGKPVTGYLYASAANRPAHYSVTSCIQNKVTMGKKASAYGQGVISYKCKGSSKKLSVGIYMALGTYIA